MNLVHQIVQPVRSAVEAVHALERMQSRGIVDVRRPDRAVLLAVRNRKYGPQAGPIMQSAAKYPDRIAVIDDLGTLTYRELDERSNALARALRATGLPEGAVIGCLARDHRGLLLAISASARGGFRLALMNTGFAKPQFAEVAEREKIRAVLFDSEFDELLSGLPESVERYHTYVEEGADPKVPSIDDLIAGQDTTAPTPPTKPGGFIILTSGTTGLPKGAPRSAVSPLTPAMLVDRIPFPRQGTMLVASPIFHSTGFAMWSIGAVLADTAVLMRRFNPERALELIQRERVEMLVAVPTMLHRILQLGPEVIGRYDTSSLKVVLVSGSALSTDLAKRWQDTFGDNLHNLYGSTEVAVASVAQPQELRLAPGTVGRAVVTTRIALFDADGKPVTEPGVSGRIFVKAVTPFEGYTDGRHKDFIDGYMSSGDMGHFDENGLLFVDGRDDDMIVSGGENVYPQEVEDLLLHREDVSDVAIIGVDDPEFGRRLRAFVVAGESSKRDPQELKDYVKANLARYKVPRDIIFIDELPRNPTGKILRRVLAEKDTQG
ncbi:acyl-CoA synthetase [Millisia brevis]|uniref:acyl-CoA synthetase n=1 Tax=Millisia brevis TaxID=264148 RepID=UPI000A069E34|nr:acyl-CoA synthetase [Millisia brevis]